MKYTLHHGDCLEVLRTMPDNSVDAVVTDPPYGLSFMGKRWDYDVPSVDIWTECLRVLKPGGHLLAFAGTRTQHRMAVRIEDAGFEIRDMIAWVYGSGFPKSLDVSKVIDSRGGASVAWFGPWFRKWREDNGITQKQVAMLFPSKTGGLTGCVANWELGLNMPTPEQFNLIRDTFDLPFASVEEAKREVMGKHPNPAGSKGNTFSLSQECNLTAPATEAAKKWHGWGTALKPALEPITVARKPLIGTVAENVLTWGTGGVNVDGCRVGTTGARNNGNSNGTVGSNSIGVYGKAIKQDYNMGRWPANLIHDGSEEVVGLFPSNVKGGTWNRTSGARHFNNNGDPTGHETSGSDASTGSAARFFYCAKASKRDRDEGCEGMEAKNTVNDYRPNDDGTHGLQSRLHGSTAKGRNHHPTVKPTDLMRYLCRLVTPPDGTVLDPFMGSGSTGKAAMIEGFNFIGIEREAEYVSIATKRIAAAVNRR